jgi:hypothetical protein
MHSVLSLKPGVTKSTEAARVIGQVATRGETQWGHVDMCGDAICQNGAATRGYTILCHMDK